jgi:DNA-binding transcriptional ArsR family regulator
MLISTKSYRTITLEDGIVAVVQQSATQVANLEIIATFFDPARAQEYADLQNGVTEDGGENIDVPVINHTEEPAPTPVSAPPKKRILASSDELSEQQELILQHLKDKMDEEKTAQLGNGKISAATKLPIGSVFFALKKLEEKGYISALIRGFAQTPTKWQVNYKGLHYSPLAFAN